MADMRLYNVTAAEIPMSECAILLGDNSEHGLPDPWAPALRAVLLLGMVADGQEHYRVSRHYTVRLARFPEDEEVVRRIWSEARCERAEGGRRGGRCIGSECRLSMRVDKALVEQMASHLGF